MAVWSTNFSPPTDHDLPVQALRFYEMERARLRRMELDGWRRERILDRAFHKLVDRMVTGRVPTNPLGWFRRVVGNLVKSKEIPWTREHPMVDVDSTSEATRSSCDAEDSETWRELYEPRKEWLLSNLNRLVPDVRLRSALLAWLECGGIKPAARSLDMDPRSLRRACDRAVKMIGLHIHMIEAGKLTDIPPPPPS